MNAKPATIPGAERLDTPHGKLALHQFSRVHSLLFERQSGPEPASYAVQLVLDAESRDPAYRLWLRLGGVRDLSLSAFGGAPTQITGLAIDDISDRQLESLRFEVRDVEHGTIHLLCRSVAVERVEPVTSAASR